MLMQKKTVAGYQLESEPLGKGQFGIVYRCNLKIKPEQKYAVKVIKKSNLDERKFNNLKNEINILTKIKSPNVIQLIDLQRTENNFYLIMELCNGGDLQNLKELKERFHENEARLILQQLVNGFKEIYKQQVMHRDLKLANILIHFTGEKEMEELFQISQILNTNERRLMFNKWLKEVDLTKVPFQVKIADLGFARELSHEDMTQTHCGTPIVMAPEVLNGKRYNHKADVWSLGIIFFEMITGFMPFTGKDKKDLSRNLEKGDYKFPKKLLISLQGLHFLNCCLQFDSAKRMSWNDLINHEYIKTKPKQQDQSQDNQQLQQSMGSDNNYEENELIYLTYCKEHGSYIKDEMYRQSKQQMKLQQTQNTKLLDSTMLMMNDPYNYLNNSNAILLNVRDPTHFQKLYEETIEKHLKKRSQDVMSNQPVFRVKRKTEDLTESQLVRSMGQLQKGKKDQTYYIDEEDDEDDDNQEESKNNQGSNQYRLMNANKNDSTKDNTKDASGMVFNVHTDDNSSDNLFDMKAIEEQMKQIEEMHKYQDNQLHNQFHIVMDERVRVNTQNITGNQQPQFAANQPDKKQPQSNIPSQSSRKRTTQPALLDKQDLKYQYQQKDLQFEQVDHQDLQEHLQRSRSREKQELLGMTLPQLNNHGSNNSGKGANTGNNQIQRQGNNNQQQNHQLQSSAHINLFDPLAAIDFKLRDNYI